jgi:phosphoglycerate dehydrogenase-like enzyme
MRVLVLAEPTLAELCLLENLPSTFEVTIEPDPANLGSAIKDVEVVFNCLLDGYREKLEMVLAQSPKLWWVHTWWTGVDNLPLQKFKAADVVLTNARGAYARPLAEFVLGACIYFAKDFPRLIKQQQQRIWDRFESQLLFGKTVGIFGYGEAGRYTAEALSGLGVKILACRRNPLRSEGDQLLAQLYAPEKLQEMASLSDYLVVSAPLTPQTRGIIDAELLAAMKSSAVLINIGRGQIVCEAALTDALKKKTLRGAALDVTAVEPLPASSPLWEMENVLLSPHCADRYPGWQDRPVEMFIENCNQILSGKKLKYVVDLDAGY